MSKPKRYQDSLSNQLLSMDTTNEGDKDDSDLQSNSMETDDDDGEDVQDIGEDESLLNVEAELLEENTDGSSLDVTVLDKEALIEKYRASWDPFSSPEWDKEEASSLCIRRLKRDLTTLFSEAPPLIYLVPEEDDLTKLHAVISGPEGTPYEGGFFYFFLRAPPQYPFRPLKVKLMTTGNGIVRFNPNFYKNGKVCLSILGTWSGPAWTASQSILSVVLSIQSLMNENPYFNEPGFQEQKFPGASEMYNQCITHETLRVAVCDFMESQLSKLPESMQDILQKSFLVYSDHYRDVTKRYQHLDGEPFRDPHKGNLGNFQFMKLQERIDVISERLMKTHSE